MILLNNNSIFFVCDRSQPKPIFQKAMEPEENKDDDIEPAWKKKKVWESCKKANRNNLAVLQIQREAAIVQTKSFYHGPSDNGHLSVVS